MTTSITAIVPTHNRAHWLAEAVHAILSQSRRVSEIIVWDDGSTDGTAEIASQLSEIIAGAANPDAVPDFRYYYSVHAGRAAAINNAIALAQGDAIWVCDHSNIALPHAVETLAQALEADRDLVAVGGSYRRFWVREGKGQRVERGPDYWPTLESGNVVRHLLEGSFLYCDGMIVRKSALEACGPFREDLAFDADYDMCLRLACSGRFEVLDDPVFLRRTQDGEDQAQLRWSDEVTVLDAMRDRISLDIYEGMYRSTDPKFVRRAAFLQRACTYARHGNWQLAARDFADAAKTAPGFRLSLQEKAICKRAFSGKPLGTVAMSAETRSSLREIAAISAAGGSIARTVAKSLAADARQSSVTKVSALASTLTIYTNGFGRGEQPPDVFETGALPESIYRVI